MTIEVSPETYRTLVIAAKDRDMTVAECAAMMLTLAAGDEWRSLSLDRDLLACVEEPDPAQEPLPERPRWPQD